MPSPAGVLRCLCILAQVCTHSALWQSRAVGDMGGIS